MVELTVELWFPSDAGQTTEEVEAAKKAGQPTEEPVSASRPFVLLGPSKDRHCGPHGLWPEISWAGGRRTRKEGSELTVRVDHPRPTHHPAPSFSTAVDAASPLSQPNAQRPRPAQQGSTLADPVLVVVCQVLKIEIPANRSVPWPSCCDGPVLCFSSHAAHPWFWSGLFVFRYDLLCIEGLALALRVFLNLQAPPVYSLSTPSPDKLVSISVSASVAEIRPYFAGAVLRFKESFTPASYKSFIDLQDKLHSNLCRARKFVAIGTHDLDTIKGPLR